MINLPNPVAGPYFPEYDFDVSRLDADTPAVAVTVQYAPNGQLEFIRNPEVDPTP